MNDFYMRGGGSVKMDALTGLIKHFFLTTCTNIWDNIRIPEVTAFPLKILVFTTFQYIHN